MKKLYILLLTTFLIVTLAACGSSTESKKTSNKNNKDKQDEVWEDIKESGELVIGTSGTLIAASFYEDDDKDELTGFDVDVTREIAKRLDLKPKYEIIGIDGMMTGIKSGRIDVAANDIEITDKRKKQFAFSEPYKYSYTPM